MGTLTLSGGSILDFELGQAGTVGGALNDLINVNGNLTLDGTLNVSAPAGGTYGAGIYRLINYTGTLTDNGLELGSMPAGSASSIQTSVAQQVNLINSAGLLLSYWDGPATPRNDGVVDGGTGTWLATPGNENWATMDGTINAPYQDASFAVFSGSAGTVTVDNTLGDIRITGMQFSANGYRIEGDAVTLTSGKNSIRVGDGTSAGVGFTATIASALTGGGGLEKGDLGTLVLTGASTYTGGTTITAGTLQLGDGGTSGSLVGDVTNNGTLAFDRSDTGQVFGGVISGSGAVNQIGTGTTTLTGVNTYTGATTISSGTLALSGAGSIASSSSVEDNGIFDISATSAGASIRTLSGGGSMALGSQALTLTAAAGQFSGVVSGTGTLNKAGPDTWALTGTGSSVGTLNVREGALQIASGAGIAAQTTNVAAGTTLSIAGLFTGTSGADRFTLAGTLTGHVNLADGNDLVRIAEGATFSQARFDGGAGTDQLDLTNNAALTLPATLASNFEILNKLGSGSLTLADTVDSYSSGIRISAGTAVLSNATVQTGQLTVQSGATLTGTGSLSGGLTNNGSLLPGIAGTSGNAGIPGTLHIGGNFVQGTGGLLVSKVQSGGNDLLSIAGSATLSGTQQIHVVYGLYLNGTTQTLIQASGGITGDFASVAINPSVLMPVTRKVSATAETLSFTLLPVASVTMPGTNQQNFAMMLDKEIDAGGLPAGTVAYVDTLLQQPTKQAVINLLGEIAEPPASSTQKTASTVSTVFGRSIFARFINPDGAACDTPEPITETISCAWMHGLHQWGTVDGGRFRPRI